jgi:hypothetical protein
MAEAGALAPTSPKRTGPLWDYDELEAAILQERRVAATAFLSSLSSSAAADPGFPQAPETSGLLLVQQRSSDGLLDPLGSHSLAGTQQEGSEQLFLKQVRSLESLSAQPLGSFRGKSGANIQVSNIQVISGHTMNLLRKSNAGLLSMVDGLGHSRIQFATEQVC